MSQPRNKSKANSKNNKSNPTQNPVEPTNGAGLGANNQKLDDLAPNVEESAGEFLSTNQGIRVNDNQNSLKAGDRGPTLIEDFIFREKMTHFDHERIPERVVHARGTAAHGYFQVYESMAEYTRAHFLQDPLGVELVLQAFQRAINRFTLTNYHFRHVSSSFLKMSGFGTGAAEPTRAAGRRQLL